MFRSWQEALPDDIEVWGIQLPGRANRVQEAFITSASKLVAEMAEAVASSDGTKFAFFGHSMGATLAFELARYFRRQGYQTPASLFVSGKRAPHLPADPAIHKKQDQELLADLVRLNGIPAELVAHPELLEQYLPIFRADFELCETYQYCADLPLSCPIIAFGGTEDDEGKERRLSSWSIHTTNRFKALTVPGDHFFIHSHEQEFLELLAAELTLV